MHTPPPFMPNRQKKSLGQHFLRDRQWVERIVAACDLSPTSRVIEIGPGEGALTTALLTQCHSLLALEIDAYWANHLRQTLQSFGERFSCQVVAAQQVPFDQWGKVVVVGNLPYQVASRMVVHVASFAAYLQRLVIMVQWEVGERLLAPAGSRRYGLLSVLVQRYLSVRQVGDKIAPQAFYPPPKVDSMVLSLLPLPKLPTTTQAAMIAAAARHAFANRRKTLLAGLRVVCRASRTQVETWLQQAKIDPGCRPEALQIADFLRLGQAMQQHGALAP